MRGGAAAAVDVELDLDAAEVGRVDADLELLLAGLRARNDRNRMPASGTALGTPVACCGAMGGVDADCIVVGTAGLKLGGIAAPTWPPFVAVAPPASPPPKPGRMSVALSDVLPSLA